MVHTVAAALIMDILVAWRTTTTHYRQPGYDFREDGIPDHEDATTAHGSPDKYSTKLFRERAVNIIRNHSQWWSHVPLFLYLPFQAVHSPLQSADFWQQQFDLAKFGGDKNRWTYAAMVLEMDHAVGKVVNASRQYGLYSNSIFIISADNGGIRPGGYNWPYRGEKATSWEGGARAVGLIHSSLLQKTGFRIPRISACERLASVLVPPCRRIRNS